MKNKTYAIAILLLVVALCAPGCHKNITPGTPPAPVSVELKIAQYNQIVATANDGLVDTLSHLKDAGVISAESAAKVAVYQQAVAKATKGIAQILQTTGASTTDKLIMVQALALNLVPPAGYQKLGIQTDAQWQSLVLAIDGMESTIKLIVQMAQQTPATTGS